MQLAFANDLLNALSAHIAVLDDAGVIVAVNEAWQRFARDNGGNAADLGVGVNYLSVCEISGRENGDATANKVRDGIHALLRGEPEPPAVEYPCHASDRQRWFVVHMTRFFHQGTGYIVVAHEDITARRLAEQALSETGNTLRRVLETLPVGVWIMDRHGQIVHGNPAGKHIWCGARYVGPEQFGEYQGWWLDNGRQIAADEWAAARAIRNGETSIDEEILIGCFDGSRKIILNSALPLRDACGEITGAIIVNQDITRRKRAEEQLIQANSALDAANRRLEEALDRERSNARTDDLTRISNRRNFFELGRQVFSAAQRYRLPFSIVLFDVDNFKKLNDAQGHQAGDAALRRVATIARGHLRESDVLARYGGEEFIVALPNTGAHGALAVAENIRVEIAGTHDTEGRDDDRVTVSAGIAEIASENDTLDSVIRRADCALYMAKDAGRNCSRVFSGLSVQ